MLKESNRIIKRTVNSPELFLATFNVTGGTIPHGSHRVLPDSPTERHSDGKYYNIDVMAKQTGG